MRRAGARWGWHYTAALLRPAPAGAGEEGREEGQGVGCRQGCCCRLCPGSSGVSGLQRTDGLG